MLRKFALEWIALPTVFVVSAAVLGAAAALAAFSAGMNSSWIGVLREEPVSFSILLLTLSAYACLVPAFVTAVFAADVRNRFPARYEFHLALGTLYFLLSVLSGAADYLRGEISALYFGVWFAGLFSFLTAFLVSCFLGALVWRIYPSAQAGSNATGADAANAGED